MVIIEAMEGLDLTISLEVDRIFSEAKDFCYRKRFKGKQFDVLHETETILRGKVSEIDAQIKLWDEQIHSARANALDLTVVHAMNTVKVDMDKKRKVSQSVKERSFCLPTVQSYDDFPESKNYQAQRYYRQVSR